MSLRQILSFAIIALFLSITPAKAEMTDMDIVVLRGLDKVSARIQTFETGINQTVRFGKNLFIRVRACRKSDPIDTPESAAFLEVWQKDLDTDESHWIFSGWMFASSPALSAMDHPVYDVWVIDCKSSSTVSSDDENETDESNDDASEDTSDSDNAETDDVSDDVMDD